MISRRRESVEVLAVRVLDAFARIQEYHKLLDIATNNAPEEAELLLQCYQILSEPYRDELKRSLSDLEEQIRQLP